MAENVGLCEENMVHDLSDVNKINNYLEFLQTGVYVGRGVVLQPVVIFIF